MFPNKQQVNADSNFLKFWYTVGVERLLKIRGILEPTKGTHSLFDNKKDDTEHDIIVGSHFLIDQLNYDEVDTFN